MFLDRIIARTRQDLEERKRELPLAEVQRLAAAQLPPRDLRAALLSDASGGRTSVQLIAEVKRASPSKGMLAPHLDPVELARTYEANGAAAISVLTEPHFFLGSPTFLTAIKAAVSIPVMRKDFIFDDYQVYEARSWGADAILLICAVLDDGQLRHLLGVAHQLGMRCLVEVHSEEEARRAVEAGAAIIGVNSRDLATFTMNAALIKDLRTIIPADRVVVAESGIHSEADARRLARYNVQAMLVGESLVVSPDVPKQMRLLLKGANEGIQVKICGLSSAEPLESALTAGADLLGFIFYEPSHRYIRPQQVRNLLQESASYSAAKGAAPDLVGVFVNEEAAFINDVVEQCGLDFVQLHGNESPELCQQINRPVIKALHVERAEELEQLARYSAVVWRLLLDTPTPGWGGAGVTNDWGLARLAAEQYPILLAGGLSSENVAEAVRRVHPWGVDVSSGVETNKRKDSAKIRAFIQNVRALAST